jgi:hypothetical protein
MFQRSLTLKLLIRCKGIQITNDTSSFAGFINSFVVSLRDEAVKLPYLVFPLLSDSVSRQNDIHDVAYFLTVVIMCSYNRFQNRGMRLIINDALYLRTLSEISSMSVPIQAPSVWPSEAWYKCFETDVRASHIYFIPTCVLSTTNQRDSLYHTSAILSAHLESSTFPIR